MRLAAHEGNVAKSTDMRGGDPCDLVGVGEIACISHRVNQDDALEFLPGVRGAQYRQEGSQSGAGRETPERRGRRHLRNAEKAVRALEEPYGIADVERGKPGREGTFGQHVEVE